MKKIATLHYITQNLNASTHAESAAEACQAGVNWVQLRVKDQPYEKWLQEAKATREICNQFNCTFIVNDNAALAKEVNADGVHLGKTDMAPQEARKILGEEKIIGGTANTFEDILRLAEAGVDYIGLGPFRFTTTKENLSPILGLEGYATILQQCKEAGITIPIIAIGGIIPEDVKSLLLTGIHGVAVSSGINKAVDKKQAVKMFQQAFANKQAEILELKNM